MALPYRVRLFATREAFDIDQADYVLSAPSKEKAARKAAYALLEVPLGPTPGKRWLIAQCLAGDGSWVDVLSRGPG